MQEGLSVRALADAVGTDPGNLSRIENGKSGYSEDVLKRIAEVLNVSISMLFSEHDVLQAALLRTRQVPILSALQLAAWADPDSFEHEEKQAYLYADMRRVSSFGFAVTIEDDANAPDFYTGDDLIFDVKKQPKMGSVIIAQGDDLKVFIGQCRLGRREHGEFAVIPYNRVFPITSSDEVSNLRIRGTLVEIRKYIP